MVQRLGLASCLVGEPKILFLDDPLLGLDPIGQKRTDAVDPGTEEPG